MPKIKHRRHNELEVASAQEEIEEIEQDTADLELEKLQKKIARQERQKRREIEAAKQKKAIWLLPSLLFLTMFISWFLSNLHF
jgi:hypothetical protein